MCKELAATRLPNHHPSQALAYHSLKVRTLMTIHQQSMLEGRNSRVSWLLWKMPTSQITNHTTSKSGATAAKVVSGTASSTKPRATSSMVRTPSSLGTHLVHETAQALGNQGTPGPGYSSRTASCSARSTHTI